MSVLNDLSARVAAIVASGQFSEPKFPFNPDVFQEVGRVTTPEMKALHNLVMDNEVAKSKVREQLIRSQAGDRFAGLLNRFSRGVLGGGRLDRSDAVHLEYEALQQEGRILEAAIRIDMKKAFPQLGGATAIFEGWIVGMARPEYEGLPTSLLEFIAQNGETPDCGDPECGGHERSRRRAAIAKNQTIDVVPNDGPVFVGPDGAIGIPVAVGGPPSSDDGQSQGEHKPLDS